MRSQPTPVLLLAFHFPPASESGAARPYRFYKYLPEFGYEPHVITAAEPAFPRVRSVPAPTRIPDRNTVTGFVEAATRKLLFPYDEAMLWSIAALKEAARTMRTTRFAAVISTFPPVNTHLAGYVLKRRFGVPWIADFRDPLFKPGIRGNAIDRYLERTFLNAADAAIFVSDAVHKEVVARHPALRQKIHLLWNGYNPEEELGALPTVPRPQVLLHAGNIYYKRRPSVLLESLARLVRIGKIAPGAIVLRLMGHMDPQIRSADGGVIDYLEQQGVLSLESALPRAEALGQMRRAHSLLLMDMTVGEGGYTVPAKLFEYVRIGRPILAFTTPGSPVARILEKSGISQQIVFTADQPELVDAKIVSFFELGTEAREPSQWFVDEFDGKRQTARLAKWLDELNARRSA